MAGHDYSASTPLPPMTDELNGNVLNFIHSVILNKGDDEQPFYALDLASLSSLMNRWILNLPTVRPFYAVKCFPDLSLLAKMAQLGSGFDCASRGEINTVLSLGVSPDRIVFANPCKSESHIKHAAHVGVNLATFDSEFEIPKIQKHHPNCELLIRIKAPEEGDAIFPLGKKFGVLPEEVEPLLRTARAAHLRVVGVSFHIGSGATKIGAFRTAIEDARKVFDEATRLGFPKMHLLNVGGGFIADGQLFEAAAETINTAVAEYFRDEPGLSVIAEPGRFFSSLVFTLAAKIIGKRARGKLRDYWINDGIYGSIKFHEGTVKKLTAFACVSNPRNLMCHGEMVYTSTVFGPTVSAVDTVVTDEELPELEVGDWLVFTKMGAYTWALGSNFNGFDNNSILTLINLGYIS